MVAEQALECGREAFALCNVSRNLLRGRRLSGFRHLLLARWLAGRLLAFTLRIPVSLRKCSMASPYVPYLLLFVEEDASVRSRNAAGLVTFTDVGVANDARARQ